MTKHERFESLDLFWKGAKSTFSPKIVYIYLQGEYGFIPYIIGSAVESKKEAVLEIMSPSMSVEPFNRMPNMVTPTWSVTQVSSNTCFISLTNFTPIKMMPDANPEVWAKTYPMLMDLLLLLKSRGCQQINFLTAMNTATADQPSELLVYDMFNDIRPEIDMLLTLPAWFLPYTWSKMGGKACIVCAVQDEGQYIDHQAFDMMEEYIIALGLPYDQVHKDRLTQVILSVRERVEEIGDSFDIFGDDGDGEWV